MPNYCPRCGKEYLTSSLTCCGLSAASSGGTSAVMPQTIDALTYLAGVCREALTAVRLDPAWHIHLNKDTKDSVAKAMKLIGG